MKCSGAGQRPAPALGIEQHRSFIEQAKFDFKKELFTNTNINPIGEKNSLWINIKDVPDALLPNKLIMIAHSQGSIALRGYIQSGSLAREKGFFTQAGATEK